MKFRLMLGGIAVVAAAALAVAQEAPQPPAEEKKDKPKWDVAAPPLPTRMVNINVDEGTWMDVDVSPDGRTIAFDMLGDIYTMPITGGTATRIAEGLPYEMQPQFSPDGKRIAFTSDRGGGDNIWLMNVDGSDKRQLTKEEFRLLNQPAWSPDGRFIAARKHFTTARSLGTGEIWIYHVGGGDGFVAVKKASEALQKELGEPVYAPDGGSFYYTRNVSPGPIFEYAQDSNGSLFEIEKYELATGKVSTAVQGAGGATRPAPSPEKEKASHGAHSSEPLPLAKVPGAHGAHDPAASPRRSRLPRVPGGHSSRQSALEFDPLPTVAVPGGHAVQFGAPLPSE
jgi:hypothetical protein